MLDPRDRAFPLGYAGVLSFYGLPITHDPEDLAGCDVVVLGAPTDDQVSNRPGTRYGPRAIRAASWPPGPHHLPSGLHPFEVLKVLDYGDAECVPADSAASFGAIQRRVGEIVDAGALPIVLGGDHAITAADASAVAERVGPVGLIHFDSHADTDPDVLGVEQSHGTPMYRLVEQGHVTPSRYIQIGLRGWWPTEQEFAWQRERGITTFFMDDVIELGIAEVTARAIQAAGPGPVFLTVDIDSLDPAFAPGTGTPEPGGLTTRELLWSVHHIAAELDLRGADVVEVLPTSAGIYEDITALAAERIVREIIAGIAVRKRAGT
jgi:agmatinase